MAKYSLRNASPAERTLIFLAAVLLVLAIAQEFQVRELQHSADEARHAAQAAQATLEQVTTSPEAKAQAQTTTQAVDQIATIAARTERIEGLLCGGPCPAPPPLQCGESGECAPPAGG